MSVPGGVCVQMAGEGSASRGRDSPPRPPPEQNILYILLIESKRESDIPFFQVQWKAAPTKAIFSPSRLSFAPVLVI